jgi:hypothetical protein
MAQNGEAVVTSARGYQQRRAEWRQRSSAEVHTEAGFARLKALRGWRLLGVMGFAGRWERSGLTGNDLSWLVGEARSALRRELARARDAGPALHVATGGTNTGVLELVYELCSDLGIPAVGITPDRALNYEVGAMAHVVPVGEFFGDESEAFVALCDEFLLLGGGKQSHRETMAASSMGKLVTVIQGFGGVADELSPETLPAARFV